MRRAHAWLLVVAFASVMLADAAPAADASVTVCTRATAARCPGALCVYHNTLAFIDNPNCLPMP